MDIGFIGIGNMGGAILSGYMEAGNTGAGRVLVYNRSVERCEKMKARFPQIEICGSSSELCRSCDIVIIGVKPQGVGSVLEEIAGEFTSDKTVVSMAAGVKISVFEKYLGEDAAVIRIMPNTPVMVGEGMVAVCRNAGVKDEVFEAAMGIFSRTGRAEEVDEELIDCVIGVSGSSPAYTYMYIEALMQAAVDNGMDEEKARVFAAQAVLGAARMVLESPESVEQLRLNVCSPNGTTIEAVNTLFENGFMDKVKEGFQAAVDRSVEMGKEER